MSRVEQRPKAAGFWPIRLRDPLPVIPIPLRRGDADARVDLQEVVHRIYDAAGYAYHIYSGPPEPPLSPEDAAWAEQFLPADVQPGGIVTICPSASGDNGVASVCQQTWRIIEAIHLYVEDRD